MATEGWDVLVMAWLFTPVQFVQFRYVPEPYQVPYLSVVSLFWNVALSAILVQERDAASGGGSFVDFELGDLNFKLSDAKSFDDRDEVKVEKS